MMNLNSNLASRAGMQILFINLKTLTSDKQLKTKENKKYLFKKDPCTQKHHVEPSNLDTHIKKCERLHRWCVDHC